MLKSFVKIKTALENCGKSWNKWWVQVKVVIRTSIKGLASGDKYVSKTKEMANICNTFFTNVGKNLAFKFKSVCTSQTPDRNDVRNSLNFSYVTPHSVCKQIQSLCSANATGSDQIGARLLKTTAPPRYLTPLCYIINMSMEFGTVPKEWKHARVIPLYKDGKCDEASHYRPISVLPIFSKIME